MASPAPSLVQALADRYRVDREIGAGGMATVYLAHDLKHDRKVALKVLNPELGAVLGIERFLSEIRVTANLQHPNLLPLFDSGEVGGQLFYVMPFVEGESLRARLEREKQLPVDDAVRITLAVAGALDYAHAHDVIHRDLKPENILLQHGEPVIADFGIALAVSKAGGSRVTQTGLSLGTPQYMSPEQATGDRAIDGRSDIYSLGACLYEMIGGEAPHTGSTGQAIIAKLMTEEPRRLENLRRSVPPHVADSVHRALEKLPADRWKSAREFADALRGARTATTAATRAARPPARPAFVGAGIALGVAIGVAIGAGIARGTREAPGPAATLRFHFVTPDSARFVPTTPAIPFAVSPDDRRVAYVGAAPNGRRIYVRSLDDLQTRALPGSDGAPLQPTFSPDGEWIAFVIDGRLVKTPVAGGTVNTVMPLEGRANAGMHWALPDTLIASIGGRLMAVPADGGPPVTLATPDTGRGELLQWGPRVADRRFVYYIVVGSSGMSGNRLGILDRKTGTSTPTDILGTTILGALDQRLLWVTAQGAVMAADIGASGTLGPARRVLEDVLVRPGGAAKAAISPRGTLVYHRGIALSRLVLVDERGVASPYVAEARAFSHPRWSPDGRRVAVAIARTGGSDIWIIEGNDRFLRRLTSGGIADQPEWTADGRSVVYRLQHPDGNRPMIVPVDGSAAPKQLIDSLVDPYSVRPAPDGRHVVYAAVSSDAANGGDLGLAELGNPRSGRFIAQEPMHQYVPAVSPDGKWLAYGSGHTGRQQVYVRPFPGPGAAVPIAHEIGSEPLWAADGRGLYFRGPPRAVFFARLAFGATVSVAGVTELFSGDYLGDSGYGNWDVSPNGRQFLMLQNFDRQEETIVVYNWASEVRAPRN